MRKRPQAIDGFVPRASSRTLGDIHKTSIGRFDAKTTIQQSNQTTRPIQQASEPRRSVSRRDVDESLKGIDDESAAVQRPKRRGLFRRKTVQQAPARKGRKLAKRLAILVLIIGILFAGYVGVKMLISGMSVLNGSVFGLLQNKPLKQDENGRTNILVFGTSGSVDDSRHEGANLTDTLMVLSINQAKKDAYMVSLPRDLYVKYGDACPEGNSGKINSMYDCFSGAGEDQLAGAEALQGKMKEVTGLDTQYFAHINWAVVVGAVDAVGGVNVNVEGNGYSSLCSYYGIARGGVVDANMKVRYEKGTHAMAGEEALRFARARGSAGECGLAGGDFDRQKNQQKVLKALQAKAMSSETLSNFGKVNGLIEAFGANLKTNFDTSEVRTLMALAKDIPSDKIQSIDLVDDEDPLIRSGNIPGAGSTQAPTAGTYDYSEIISFIHKTMNANAVTKEAAVIDVYNGSGISGYAAKQQLSLESKGFTVGITDNAPDGEYAPVGVYDLTSGAKPETSKKLASIYGVTVKTGTPPVTVTGETDFVIIFGQGAPALSAE